LPSFARFTAAEIAVSVIIVAIPKTPTGFHWGFTGVTTYRGKPGQPGTIISGYYGKKQSVYLTFLNALETPGTARDSDDR
jgi:hypothetical protein